MVRMQWSIYHLRHLQHEFKLFFLCGTAIIRQQHWLWTTVCERRSPIWSLWCHRWCWRSVHWPWRYWWGWGLFGQGCIRIRPGCIFRYLIEVVSAARFWILDWKPIRMLLIYCWFCPSSLTSHKIIPVMDAAGIWCLLKSIVKLWDSKSTYPNQQS